MYVAFVLYGYCKSRSGDVAHVAYVAIVFRGMFQYYVSSVSDVSEVCFICVFWTHVVIVFI